MCLPTKILHKLKASTILSAGCTRRLCSLATPNDELISFLPRLAWLLRRFQLYVAASRQAAGMDVTQAGYYTHRAIGNRLRLALGSAMFIGWPVTAVVIVIVPLSGSKRTSWILCVLDRAIASLKVMRVAVSGEGTHPAAMKTTRTITPATSNPVRFIFSLREIDPSLIIVRFPARLQIFDICRNKRYNLLPMRREMYAIIQSGGKQYRVRQGRS